MSPFTSVFTFQIECVSEWGAQSREMKQMKIVFIITFTLAFAGCAANQSYNSDLQARVRAADESEHPELAGLTKEQIAHLLWRIE